MPRSGTTWRSTVDTPWGGEENLRVGLHWRCCEWSWNRRGSLHYLPRVQGHAMCGRLLSLQVQHKFSELWELIHKEENTGHSGPTSTPHLDETYSKTMLGGAQSIAAGEQKTLGVKWCMETDHFMLDVSEVGHQARSLSPTKKHIVSFVGRI